MKNVICTSLFFFSIILLPGCASIVSKSVWPLTINTKPGGADIEITNKKGETVFIGTSPSICNLKSSCGFFQAESYQVKIRLAGYEEKIIPVNCSINGWYFGNIFLGGLIGMLIVDPATGAMYRLEKESIYENLTNNNGRTEASLKILTIDEVPVHLRNNLIAIK